MFVKAGSYFSMHSGFIIVERFSWILLYHHIAIKQRYAAYRRTLKLQKMHKKEQLMDSITESEPMQKKKPNVSEMGERQTISQLRRAQNHRTSKQTSETMSD